MLSLGGKTYPEQLIFSLVVKYITRQFPSEMMTAVGIKLLADGWGVGRKTLITCSLFTAA